MSNGNGFGGRSGSFQIGELGLQVAPAPAPAPASASAASYCVLDLEPKCVWGNLFTKLYYNLANSRRLCSWLESSRVLLLCLLTDCSYNQFIVRACWRIDSPGHTHTHTHPTLYPCILASSYPCNMANSRSKVEKGLCSRQQAAQDDA